MTTSRFKDGGLPMAISLAIGIHAWILMFRAATTLARVWRVIRPGGAGIPDHDFWAFGDNDTGYRPFYLKNARDMRMYGSDGFAWMDGLGSPMGDRFFQNIVTYRLVEMLGNRGYSLAIWAGTILAALAVLLAGGLPAWAVVPAIVLVAASPQLVQFSTTTAKPELMWNVMTVPALWLAFGGHALEGGLVWSALTLCNLPVSLMVMLGTGPAVVLAAVMGDQFPQLAMGLAPGLVINLFRIRPRTILATGRAMSGFTLKRPWLPALDDVLTTSPILLAAAIAAWCSGQWWVAALGVNCALLYYVNFRVTALNDYQSFDALNLAAGIGIAAATASPAALAVVVLGAYRMRHIAFQALVAEGLDQQFHATMEARGLTSNAARWTHVLSLAVQRLNDFPDAPGIRYPANRQLRDLLYQIPDQSRVIWETASEMTPEGKPAAMFPPDYPRAFWTWTELELPLRGVELINDEWALYGEAELSDKYLRIFNGWQLPPERMAALCDALGVDHAMAYTQKTLDALLRIGFVPVQVFDVSLLPEQERKVLQLRMDQIALLRKPQAVSRIVSPAPATWTRKGRTLSIDAVAGTEYTVRYAYHPRFKARLGDVAVPVEPFQPLDDVPVRLMKLTAPADGRLDLTFG